jgi:hypothetical protein
MYSAIDEITLPHFVALLNKLHQDDQTCPAPDADLNALKSDWVFKNMDYVAWRSSVDCAMLRISGPPSSNLHQLQSSIMKDVKEDARRRSLPDGLTLYSFCSGPRDI